MRLYPEWFIGGPWHGRDKMKVCPHLQSSVRVAMVPPIDFRLASEVVNGDLTLPDVREYIYIPKRADVFGEPVIVWVGEQEAGLSIQENGDVAEWVRMFGQLIMSPHRKNGPDEPFSVERYADVHRQRFDIEQEVRHRLDREYSGEITRLRQRIAFLAHTAPGQPAYLRDEGVLRRQTDSKMIEDAPGDAALLKMKVSGTFFRARFDDITIYEDLGDDENPPGFVATAQAMGKTPDGDQDMIGFTGFGPDHTSAVVALLADGLGYYARLTDYGSKGRMR